MSDPPVGILLAAGKGQRFGSNKLLHPVIDDTPMLLVSAQKLASVLPESMAVISQELVCLQAQLEQLGLQVVVNEQAERGMGSSIACGVRASEDAAGWLIALADMPYIKSETISKLSNRMKAGAAMVAPVYKQQRGHPVGFGQKFRDELLALNDDVGARYILAHHKEQFDAVVTNDVGVIADIDRMSDLAGS